jgi:hypothetical protein
MVLHDGKNDHLYLGLANSDSDISWTDKPAWLPCPFNARDNSGAPIQPPAPFRIASIFISEATDKEYIVADVIRNPADRVGLLSRFYIDVSNPSSPVWTPHDLAIDIEAASYSSCLGRTSHAFGVDGLYTKGTIGDSLQLIYTPLYNPFDPGTPPAPSRLKLPEDVPADAIAASRRSDNTSDLYVVARSGLYYFASTNQRDEAVGTLLLTHPLLSGARFVFASETEDAVTVWGLNASNQVFYSTCPVAQIASGAAWSRPIVVLAGVDAISPYIDRRFSANTFFAHSASGLIRMIKTPATGLWSRRNITLPPTAKQQDARRISSYTTQIQVTGRDGRVAANVSVELTAVNVTSVYINHLYYVVGPVPISVPTDARGTVTIVETAHTLAGTRFIATVEGQTHSINPMDAPFQRSAALDSVASLQNAVITHRDGSTRPFIPAGVSKDDLQKVAQSNKDLRKAYTKIAASAFPQPLRATAASPAAVALSGGILADLGDLFSWLESGIEAVISIIEDTAENVWHFVAEIGGSIYYGILDAVEKVVAAAVWIYNAIKIIIEDIILFLEFLFLWPDILITHRVMKNVFTRFVRHSIDELSASRAALPALFRQLESGINKWADIPYFGQTPGSIAGAHSSLPGEISAPAHLGLHLFQGNGSHAESHYMPEGPGEEIFKDLLNLLANEEETLLAAYQAIQTDIISQFSSLSLTEIIKRFVAIVTDTLLQSAENILLAVLDVFIQLTAGLMDVLTAPVDIPVISWLYHTFTGDDLSFLDLICLVAAIPATIIYKATAESERAGNVVPFPRDDAFTRGLLDAGNFDQVKAQFFAPGVLQAGAGPVPAVIAAENAVLNESRLKVLSFVADVFAFAGGIVLTITSAIQKTFDSIVHLPVPYAKTMASIAGMANIAYVSPNIPSFLNSVAGITFAQVNNLLTGISIVKGLIAIPFTATTSEHIRLIFPFAETILNIVWNLPVIENIIANYRHFDTTYKSLIPESAGNFAFNLGGILEFPIATIEERKIKLALTAVQDGLMLAYGSLMIVAGGIYEWAPGQTH